MTTKWKMPKWQTIVGWLTTLSAVIVAVTPVLPASTPDWIRPTLGLVAVVIAAILQSPRKIPPTVAEAHETLAKAAERSVRT